MYFLAIMSILARVICVKSYFKALQCLVLLLEYHKFKIQCVLPMSLQNSNKTRLDFH